MTTARISPTELLQTTNAYFGNGAYAISGSTITLTSDTDRPHPRRGNVRVEQLGKDGVATWTDRCSKGSAENSATLEIRNRK